MLLMLLQSVQITNTYKKITSVFPTLPHT